MNTIIRTTAISLLIAAATAATAQTRFDLQKHDPAESTYDDAVSQRNDIENDAAYTMYSHPALAGLTADTTCSGRGFVQARLTNDISHGPYIHYQGNHNISTSVTAGGEMTVKGVGTLYGHAMYERRQQHGMYQNYAVTPADYLPYLVADSVSTGDVSHERYLITGGLSMTHGTWRYGISALYDGTASAKETQPRRAVYSYWVRLGLSVARMMPRWIAAVKISPELNRQSISASSSLVTYRFMQFYGMGQWNRKESTSGYGYGRDARILGIGGSLLLKRRITSDNDYDASLSLTYNYRSMQTEESTFKNAYTSATHHLSHRITASAPLSSNVRLHILLDGEADIRKGRENVYERQKMDAGQTLYDYVLVGHNDLYRSSRFSEQIRLKAVAATGSRHTLSLSAGARLDAYKEQYDHPLMKAENTTADIMAGVGYAMSHNRLSVDWELTAAYRLGLDNKYNGLSPETNVFEAAQAYIPYLLRGENRWLAQSSLICSHKLPAITPGVRLSARYDNRVSAPYAAGVPAAGTGSRSGLWLDMALFCTF